VVRLMLRAHDRSRELAEAVEQHARARMELDKHREHLEELVEARSAELKATNDELRQMNAELEQFAYVTSHDLKTPLITFRGYLGRASKQVERDDKEGVTHSIDRMKRAAIRMSTLIDDLLDLSRIGRVTHDPQPIALRSVVKRFEEEQSERLASTGIQIEFDSDLPTIVFDPVRLTQLVDNLLTNAIKYGCPNGNATIHIGAQSERGKTRFYVRDHGPGIAPEFHTRIFGLFNRLEASSQIEGTGVGLTVVRRIVENAGGRIWVESEAGRGATFWVELPLPLIPRQNKPQTTTI